ncbi:hypothetical protein GVN16_25125 [Emticicia sp. CRIBPO]|uniref:antiviral reverse transcriptase Drt2 n=1 Tax=Emticicia sp. CRIBPO TaxID=2683258 RepID=UPI00141285BF|nr:antiviral reverse transcriptase Drt2 [Emticicia sp. CRIBPO]NBA89084.1 hypothetical protein [Emticicia sp. CRIBPO]
MLLNENDEFEKNWQEWSELEEANYTVIKDKAGREIKKKYKKKGYTHFDLRIWFPKRKEELKALLKNQLKTHHKEHKKETWWSFRPFLKILIKTPRYKYQESDNSYNLETKIRPICFASHTDSLIFSFYAHVLNKKYQEYISSKNFDECVLAYRSDLGGKCNIQFSKEVFDDVKKRGNCTAIALDIKGYFDNIDHLILKEKWNKVMGGTQIPEDHYKLYKALTKYSYVNKSSLLRKYNNPKENKSVKTLLDLIPGKADFEKYSRLRDDKLITVNKGENKNRPIGIPQGSGMSAVLSNIYLLDFDREFHRKSQSEGFLYRRYCDDILLVCESSKAEELETFIIEKIKNDCLLTIQDKKVEIIEFKANSKGVIRGFNKKKKREKNIKTIDYTNEKHFYKPLQYLGFEFNGQDVLIRSSSLSRYYRKMKSRIIKTVSMAYNNKESEKIWKAQLFEKYTHLGKRNFLAYAFKASKEVYKNSKNESKPGLNSPAIRKQLKRHFDILLSSLQTKNRQRFKFKSITKKTIALKKV